MNHPKREEWVPYLFGETNSKSSRELKAHLRSCAECREELQGWESNLARLDAWKLPRATTAGEVFQPLFRWAAAAALALCLGIGIGRITAAKAGLETVRAASETAMRQD